jgi:hypothetical protein
MTDPKRWCDEPQALFQTEQRVLMADARLGPPHGAKSEVWTNLLAGLGAGATGAVSGAISHGATTPNGSESLVTGGAAAGGGTVGSALHWAIIVKSALVVTGIGACVAVVSHYATSRAGTSSPWSGGSPQSSAVAVQNHRNASPGIEPAAFDEQAAVPSGRVAEPDTGGVERLPSSARLNQVAAPVAASAAPNAREESQLIGAARTALRGGDTTGALQLLDRAQRRYPRGVLVQEREALLIEALAAVGRTAEARARADAFVRAYPKSPHAARVKSCTAE